MTRGRPAKPGILKVGREISAGSAKLLAGLVAGRPKLELEIKRGKLNSGESVFFYGAQRRGGDYHGSSGHGTNEAEAVRALVRFVEGDEKRQKFRADQPPLRKCVDKKPRARGAKKPAPKKPAPRAAKKPTPKKPEKKSDKLTPPAPAKYLQDLIHSLAPYAMIKAKAMDLREEDERGPLWRASFICPRGSVSPTSKNSERYWGGRTSIFHASRMAPRSKWIIAPTRGPHPPPPPRAPPNQTPGSAPRPITPNRLQKGYKAAPVGPPTCQPNKAPPGLRTGTPLCRTVSFATPP